MIKTKKRINISVSKELNEALTEFADRDNMPVATKALDLIKKALDIEEDLALEILAQERDKNDAEYLTHEQVWQWRKSCLVGRKSSASHCADR